MTNLLNVEGKEYIVATAAAKQFGYTKDYLLLLIKEKKVEGLKVGNRWYVYVPSAEVFFKKAELARIERRKQVSRERKTELKRYSRTRFAGTHRTAVLETLAIVVIGLSLGATGYLGTTATQSASVSQSSSSFFEAIAISLYSLFSTDEEVATVLSLDSEAAAMAQSESRMSPESVQGLIVAPNELLTSETINSIKDSFSDPVEVSVDPLNPETGLIVPKFKDGEGEAYRFLMVPVTTE